jgi:choice-of-anchor B domain-containing protein
MTARLRTAVTSVLALFAVLALAAPALAADTVSPLSIPDLVRAEGLDPSDGKALSDAAETLTPESIATVTGLECTGGMAGPYPCENVHLESFVPLAALGGGTGNDIWGWTDPKTGNEYAIMGTSNGTAFVDVTDPRNPFIEGVMATQSPLLLPLWRDVKVYDNHAFVVSEHDNHGIQVFDLTRLRAANAAPSVFTPDAVYSEFGSAHNIAINQDSGFAYAVGTDTCEGGLHMVDIRDAKSPTFAGCFDADGYTHDVQCVLYFGADARFRGREICFASNEDTVTIADVTDKANPRLLSRNAYEGASYTHQGWLTPDHRWFLFGDELDEFGNTVDSTTTYIMEVRRLTEPARITPYTHESEAIDHNLYIEDGFVWQSNYVEGLRVLDYSTESLRGGELDEVGFFDVVPAVDVDQFAGTWSNYPFFESGTVVVSTLEEGLFVLRPELPADREQQGRERPGKTRAR